MSKVSSKRQITLPLELCLLAGIDSGDEVSTFVDRQGIISVVKKKLGSAKGFLSNIAIDNSITDEDSLNSHFTKRHHQS